MPTKEYDWHLGLRKFLGSKSLQGERSICKKVSNELRNQELELHRHRREELDDRKNLVEKGLQEDDNMGPEPTKWHLLDRLVPNVRMNMVVDDRVIIGRHDCREEANTVDRDHLGPAIHLHSEESSIRWSEIQKVLTESALLIDERDVRDQKNNKDNDYYLRTHQAFQH